jgi:hypothetical protein
MLDPPRIKNCKTGKVHAVAATGGPGDGSLHGFYLYCGPQIDLEECRDWEELDASDPVTCGTCRRGLQASEESRHLAALRQACYDLLADAAARPGAYIHARGLEELSALLTRISEDRIG